jgi:hypothetical protein
MEYTIKDFIDQKFVLRVKPDQWSQFVEVMEPAGVKWAYKGGLHWTDISNTFGISVPGNPKTLTHNWERSGENIPIVDWADFKAGLDKPTDKPPQPAPKKGDRIRILVALPNGAVLWKGDTQIVSNPDIHGDGTHAVLTTDAWHISSDKYEIIGPSPKIVITTDGKTTTARMYEGKRVVREGKATCSPEDKFDYDYGAQLAFDRLMNGPKAAAPFDYDALRDLDASMARVREKLAAIIK